MRNVLTVIVVIKPNKVENLKRYLSGLQLCKFSKLDLVHFCRWVVIDSDPNYKPCLAFTSNFDEDSSAHLKELFATLNREINEIYTHCDGVAHGGFATHDDFVNYMHTNNVNYGVFHAGYRGHTLGEIRANTSIWKA